MGDGEGEVLSMMTKLLGLVLGRVLMVILEVLEEGVEGEGSVFCFPFFCCSFALDEFNDVLFYTITGWILEVVLTLGSIGGLFC